MPTPTPTPAKSILLTGASSGIGAELARCFARRGFRLALTARRADRLEALASECRGLGAEVIVLPADLGDVAAAAGLVEATVAAFGGIDVLVNNAAYGLAARFAQAEPADLIRQFDVNLVSPVLLARHALPHLIERRGTIINIGSSLTAVPLPLFGIYGTTKAALAYWNDALRREVRALGVRVCLVEPGPVVTEFIPSVEARGPVDLLAFELRPPRPLSATAEEAARRIGRLVDRPKRRIEMYRRVVWPLRAIGGLFRLWPAFGDLMLSGIAAPPASQSGGGRR